MLYVKSYGQHIHEVLLQQLLTAAAAAVLLNIPGMILLLLLLCDTAATLYLVLMIYGWTIRSSNRCANPALRMTPHRRRPHLHPCNSVHAAAVEMGTVVRWTE